MSLFGKLFGKKNNDNSVDGLRAMVLASTPHDLGLTIAPNQSFGVLMEMGMEGTVVTIASIADGSVSMYIRDGQSIIGAGEHPEVRAEGLAFVAESTEFLKLMHKTDVTPLPGDGVVTFYIKTVAGTYTTSARLATIEDNPIFPLFMKGQDVLTQIRLTTTRLDQR